jgi:dTDP-4-dehydrorhamnose 3,5-epimerase
MPFKFNNLERVPGVVHIIPQVFSDERGWFMEVYKSSEFLANGLPGEFLQINQSFSRPEGTIRGLHLQLNPSPQGKLVRCVRGSIFDVAVDIRDGSPNYLQWVGVTLSANNREMLWVPEGLAHGFQTLEEDTEVIYLTTNEYSPELERTILWNDPVIGIDWPIRVPILNDRDATAPTLEDLTGGEDL